jgi:hypothetical protein
LLLDDGPLIDALKTKKAFRFDPEKHSFDPLAGMDYRKARDFVSVLDAVFPEGENTLTRKNSNFLMLKELLSGKRLSGLIELDPKDPASVDAYQKIQTLLLSPVLKRVLCNTLNFRFEGTVLARLDRAKYGEFDCFVLAQLLISQFKGTVVIPDFGFYGRDYLTYLIREERLVCSVNSLSEVSPKLRDALLLMEDKEGKECSFDDARTLAGYRGLVPGTTAHVDYVQRLVERN